MVLISHLCYQDKQENAVIIAQNAETGMRTLAKEKKTGGQRAGQGQRKTWEEAFFTFLSRLCLQIALWLCICVFAEEHLEFLCKTSILSVQNSVLSVQTCILSVASGNATLLLEIRLSSCYDRDELICTHVRIWCTKRGQKRTQRIRVQADGRWGRRSYMRLWTHNIYYGMYVLHASESVRHAESQTSISSCGYNCNSLVKYAFATWPFFGTVVENCFPLHRDALLGGRPYSSPTVMNERVEKVFVNLSKNMEWLLALGLISGGGCDDTSEIWEDTDGRGSQEYSRLFGQCLATLWHEVWPLWTDFYLFIPVCTIRSHHGVVPQTMVLSFRHGVGPAS